MHVKPQRDEFFFLHHNDKDTTWYCGCFEQKEAKAYGEVSPDYTNYPAKPGVPERMHALLPEAKLIYLVRDPIERAISNYTHNYAAGHTNRSVEEALSPKFGSQILENSKYYMQIEKYLDYYNIDRILFIKSEDLFCRTQNTLEDIYEFIGVENISTRYNHKKFNSSEEKEVIHSVYSFMIKRKIGVRVKQVAKSILPKTIVEEMKKRMVESVEKPSVGEELRIKMKEYLRDDTEKFRSLTGQAFDSWEV